MCGRYILIAPAMGKLHKFLLIILCGNDCNSGFYDKSNAFIFFYLKEEFIEATNSFSCIFYFVLVKFFSACAGCVSARSEDKAFI